MAKDQCSEYDTTAANNTVVGDVDISEGTAPSNINNSIRELMSHLKNPQFGDVTATGTVEPAGDTAAGDNAAIGYTAAEGLILTGQGSTNDLTIKNDADAEVCGVPTGTDDLKFPDNAGAIFGTGSDLKIYHDGSNSYIADAGGTGNITLQSDQVNIVNAAGNETVAQFNQDGACVLYHNNVNQLETTATGVVCAGNVTAYSSAAAKCDIETLTGALDQVEKLRGVSFRWKDRDEDRKTMGFIMEEVAEAVPELARDTGVMYQNTVSLLVEAIKELRAEIRELKDIK
tara:strand:- start:792 stop:1652 length:861 start_codon:yes stop_codon:yes gene_type:complete